MKAVRIKKRVYGIFESPVISNLKGKQIAHSFDITIVFISK